MATPIPTNRAGFDVEAVLASTGGELVHGHSGGWGRQPCLGVATDSREDVSDKLFVALTGDKFDAHRFVPDVIARGAWGAIVERSVPEIDGQRLIRVPSTIEALGRLAQVHRKRWGGRLVTIGGSAGKTTTRVAISTLLEQVRPGRVHSTIGNLNNLIGVPMTLLGLEPQHDVAAIEVGTNQPGEVTRLAALCQADVAVLTCIGLEHCEGLGDLDGVEAEEAALFSSVPAARWVIGNHDDSRVLRQLQHASRSSGTEMRSYGTQESATYSIRERLPLNLTRSRLRIRRKLETGADELDVVTRLFGLPGALATAAAIAVADSLVGPLDASSLRDVLDRDVGEFGRLRVIERSDRALVIDDCYNANPVSMRSSIAAAKELATTRQARLRVVIGDMLELGELSCREHAALTEDIAGVDSVIAIGNEVAALVARARQLGLSIVHFTNPDLAIDHVREVTRPGDVVLVKGSRGMRLERIVGALTEGEGHSP